MKPLNASSAGKVAEVTLMFWVMKILATTLGETAGDLLSMTLKVGYAYSSLILIGLFLISLTAQLRSSRFRPWVYWTVILTTSMTGTTMSDFMDRTLGLGYARGSLVLFSGLVGVLITWLAMEKTLSVSHIQTRREEIFYWMAILFSNTLGTASGDYLADDSGLGFLGGASWVGGGLGLLVLLRYTTKLNRIVLFWLAFVLTRPFGATFGDLMTKPLEKGGLNLGTMNSSLLLGGLLLVLVILQQQRHLLPNVAFPAHP